MTPFRLIAAALLGLVLCAYAQEPGARAQTVLRVSTWVPPEHEVNRTLLPGWGRAIERATGGRVRLSIDYDRGAPNRQFDLVRDGRVDIGDVFH
ncbi:MAG: C4-dicarboxylate ABC transporter substrate-binding protein, partial [Alphaproteobacteria bacterium]